MWIFLNQFRQDAWLKWHLINSWWQMATIWKMILSMYQPWIIQFWMKFDVQLCILTQRSGAWIKIKIWKIQYHSRTPYWKLSTWFSNYGKIGSEESESLAGTGHVTFWNWWCSCYFENCCYLCVSALNYLISMKFDMQMCISILRRVMCIKVKISKI